MRLAMVRRERRDDCHGNHRRYADHHDQLPRLRKVKSKNKVKNFIMNNVFSCLLVKTLYFGILSLVNNSFCPFDKIHYYLNQKYNFYTANWDLFSMYIYYWAHPWDVYNLYVFNPVYVQNSAQTYYVFNNMLPEVGTQSTGIEFHTL